MGFLKDQNAMDMIRHHYKSIERDIREMLRNLFPAGGNDFGNLVEDAAAISSADGYEVCARPGIIKARKSQRASARFHTYWFAATGFRLTEFGSGMPDPYIDRPDMSDPLHIRCRGEACLALDRYLNSKISFSFAFETASTLAM